MKVIAKDLTAETGVYVYEDASGQWLYCNGAAASQTTYATLYAFFGANAYAADSGGNFILPDCRGRALHFAGTNAATDLNDNDGVAEASRTPTQSASITGTTDAESSHTHGAGSYGVVVPANGANGAGTGAVLGATTYAVTGTSGAGSSHSHTVTGAGNVTFPHLHAGSLLVKF
jgi:microcystin-dependent protein